MSVSGIIFSNLHDKNIPELTRMRTMASVPFACRYRLIDFALSNMVNSGISEIRVITHTNYRSLMDHIGSGKDWDLARRSGGLIVLPPFITSFDGSETLYRSRLEALLGVRSSIDHITTDYVIISDCDVICNIDLNKVLAQHIESKASITLVVKDYDFKDRRLKNTTVIDSDADNNVVDIESNPLHCTGRKGVCMNIMVLSTADLKLYLSDAVSHGYTSFMNDVIRRNIGTGKVKTFHHDGIFRNIYSMREYYDCNMELLRDEEFFMSLFGNKNRPILTKVRNSAPTKYSETASVRNSLIADGCIIRGEVENSIIFRGVHIGENTKVKNSILFQDTDVGNDCFLNCVIADKNTVIRDERILSGHDTLPFYIDKGKVI